ncbi:response regulator [Lachnospiraceae bacterium AM48-27BH]|nr:response regulator [Lachnospiraceae bacterium AM48-27BH]
MDIRTIVVDNTVELKEKLTKLLNEIPGVTVCQSFDDAVAAMQYVEEHPVDLVFSDVVMPEISGITLASSIYALPEHPEVVLLSGIPGFSLEAWKVQAFGFIIKPYTRRQIVDMIKNSGSAPDFGRSRNFSSLLNSYHFSLLTVRKSPCNPGLLPLSSAHHLTQPRLK